MHTTIITAPSSAMATDATIPVVFLAGGITSCWDWQAELISRLEGISAYLVNPRRDNWDMSDENAAEAQIAWEHAWLMRSDLVAFWFPDETLCPITLFELGTLSDRLATPICVATHPLYARRFDVVSQMALRKPRLRVGESLEELAVEIERWVLRSL